MLKVTTDTLTDTYDSKAEADKALERTKVGTVSMKDGKWKHTIPFEKDEIQPEHFLEDCSELAKLYTAEKLVKIFNSGLDLEARKLRRAELKDENSGKKSQRLESEMKIMESAFGPSATAEDLSLMQDFLAAMKAGVKSKEAFLDDYWVGTH